MLTSRLVFKGGSPNLFFAHCNASTALRYMSRLKNNNGKQKDELKEKDTIKMCDMIKWERELKRVRETEIQQKAKHIKLEMRRKEIEAKVQKMEDQAKQYQLKIKEFESKREEMEDNAKQDELKRKEIEPKVQKMEKQEKEIKRRQGSGLERVKAFALKFWTEVRKGNYEENDNYIFLPTDTYWPLCMAERNLTHVLYLRKAVKNMCASILNDMNYDRKILISGTPGIGKTWSLMYLLLQFAKDPIERDIYFAHDDMIIVFHPDGTVDVHDFWSTNVGLTRNMKYNDVYLVDCMLTTNGPIIPPQRVCSAIVIAAASPYKDKYYHDFSKICVFKYLPVWQWEDIMKIKGVGPLATISKEVLKRRFNEFGGVLRILAFTNEKPIRSYKTSIDDGIQEIAANPSFLENVMVGGHLVLQRDLCQLVEFVVDNDGDSSAIQFISPTIMNKVIATAHNRDASVFCNIIRTLLASQNHLAAGKLYEVHAQNAIKEGGEFNQHRIKIEDDSGKEKFRVQPLKRKYFEQTSQFSFVSKKAIQEIQKALGNQERQIIVPTQIGNPVFDFAITHGKSVEFFQVTVGDEHSILLPRLEALIKAFGKVSLYFVIPKLKRETGFTPYFTTITGADTPHCATENIPEHLMEKDVTNKETEIKITLSEVPIEIRNAVDLYLLEVPVYPDR